MPTPKSELNSAFLGVSQLGIVSAIAPERTGQVPQAPDSGDKTLVNAQLTPVAAGELTQAEMSNLLHGGEFGGKTGPT